MRYEPSDWTPSPINCTHKRRWLRIPRTERFRLRIAGMYCRVHSGNYSRRIKSIVHYLFGIFYPYRRLDDK